MDIVVNTINSFQGRESQVVVFALCVAVATGPFFTASHQRICISLTQKIGSIIVVGDVNTLALSTKVNKLKLEEGEEGEFKFFLVRKILFPIKPSCGAREVAVGNQP